jgi:hypothetical protein
MKKTYLSYIVYAAAALIIIGFLMPWATVATSVTGVSSGLLSSLEDTPYAGKIAGKLSEATDAIGNMGDVGIKSTVRGYQVPILVNNKSSKVAISLAQIFFEETEDLDKKSYLVYLLPIAGVVCAVLVFLGDKNKVYIIAMTVLAGAISIVGLFKLYTLDVSSTMVKISIQSGLWAILYSFLFILMTGIAWLALDKDRP